VIVEKPDDATLAGLLAQHAHRFPEKARVVVQDGDRDVAIPLLLCVPTGACKMPEEQRDIVSPAWDRTVAATFKLRPDAQEDADALVSDCVLWPDPGTWGALVARWPAMPEMVELALRRKLGGSLKQLAEPAKGEKPPVAIQRLVAMPGASWRTLTLTDRKLFLAVRSPDAGVYRLFIDAMTKGRTRAAELARGLAASTVLGIVDESGEPMSVDELFDRWCGTYLTLSWVGMQLAGMGADVELGNW
jgi:hypothetical protein